MKTEQPEALRLADLLDSVDIDAIWPDGDLWAKISSVDLDAAASELRRLYAENVLLQERHSFDTKEYSRLHSLNQELLEALKDAAHCVQENYLPDMCGYDWDELIAKAMGQK